MPPYSKQNGTVPSDELEASIILIASVGDNPGALIRFSSASGASRFHSVPDIRRRRHSLRPFPR